MVPAAVAASASTSVRGAGAKTAAAVASASTSGRGANAKTAAAAASASTSGGGAGAKIVKKSRAAQQKRKRERNGRGGMSSERVDVEHENSAESNLGTWRAHGGRKR